MYMDRVDPASVSNRSFAPPALALAVVLSTYFAWRLRGLHPIVRVFGWPLAVSVLYLGSGLIFILVNAGLP